MLDARSTDRPAGSDFLSVAIAPLTLKKVHPHMPTRDRLPPIPADKMTAEQKAAAEAIIKGPRGHLVGPFLVLLRSPEFMNRLQRTGEYLRFNSALPPRLSELAILLTARVWSQGFEWHHHRIIAEKAGLSGAIIDAIAEGRRPDAMVEDEAAVHDFIAELHKNRSVSEPTYQKALKLFGEKGIVDMTGISGYYSLLAMLMNVAGTPNPEGGKPLPTLP